jgi:hypothetical protein
MHLQNLKQHLDKECRVLRQQKEVLEQEVTEIHTQNPLCQNAGSVMPVSMSIP